MTLDERIVAILKALAKEPSRPVLFMATKAGWLTAPTSAPCATERKYGSVLLTHRCLHTGKTAQCAKQNEFFMTTGWTNMAYTTRFAACPVRNPEHYWVGPAGGGLGPPHCVDCGVMLADAVTIPICGACKRDLPDHAPNCKGAKEDE